MRQIRHTLRLARDGVSIREIGRTLGIARSTVQDNLDHAAAAGLLWPLGEEITDAVLEQRLFSHIGVKQGVRRRVEPDWPSMAREMRRPGVNLMILWYGLGRDLQPGACGAPLRGYGAGPPGPAHAVGKTDPAQLIEANAV